jgi:hypothetical protein
LTPVDLRRPHPDPAQYGDTPLHYACVTGNARIAALLLQHGARLDVAGTDGRTPLVGGWPLVVVRCAGPSGGAPQPSSHPPPPPPHHSPYEPQDAAAQGGHFHFMDELRGLCAEKGIELPLTEWTSQAPVWGCVPLCLSSACLPVVGPCVCLLIPIPVPLSLCLLPYLCLCPCVCMVSVCGRPTVACVLSAGGRPPPQNPVFLCRTRT